MSNQKITELRLMTAQHAADLLALADEYRLEADLADKDHERHDRGGDFDAASKSAHECSEKSEHALVLTTSANALLLGEMIVGLLAVIASNLQQINNPLRQPAAVDS